MEQFYSRDYLLEATPVVAQNWVGIGNPLPGEILVGIPYKKTRSTLAVDAIGFFDLDEKGTVAAIKSLIKICKNVGRHEIVIECLEEVATDESAQSINACFNSFQNEIIVASRKMNLEPPRISLEKRGQHFDLRIYPTFL